MKFGVRAPEAEEFAVDSELVLLEEKELADTKFPDEVADKVDDEELES